jgi:hypothetical protein
MKLLSIVLVMLSPALVGAQTPLPALTPAQIAASEAMAAKLDRSTAWEEARLANFKARPLAAVIQRTFNIGANYLLMAAEMMPESAYSFRPTLDVRNFGQQINHSTSSHYSFCNQAGLPPGVTRQSPPPLAQVTAKAQIVKALEDSINYCNTVLMAASETWLMEIAPRVGGSSSGLVEGIRAHAFLYNNVHDTEDYGTITTYLRMNGVVPPSSALHPAAPARGTAPAAGGQRGRGAQN